MENERGTGTGSRMQLADIAEGFALLTRLPVHAATNRGARSAWAWPLVGAIVGMLAAVAAAVSLWLGLGAGSAAAIALATQIIATGALHEDGLADCADGFWGGWDRARRLEIMKDSRIGTYGVLALVVTFVLRWSLIASLLAGGHVFAPLIVAGTLSRAPMAALMQLMPNARGEGLAAATGRPDRETVWLADAWALLVAVLLSGFAALPAAVTVILAAALVSLIADNRIGGQTGDVLGATQQAGEIAALMALVAVLPA